MITIKQQKNVRAASAYFEDHLSGNDYYLKEGKDQGRWFGKLVPELGLRGKVDKEAFDRLTAGLHPETREKLTQRLRAGRTSFFDFTCSAPKSVSIVGVIGRDNRVVECHRKATSQAMAYLEKAACVRERKGADVLTTRRTYTGKIVGAYFDHDASRSLDCQLHRHFCVFNVTQGVDGKLMALDSRRMYDRSQTATEVYRNELAKGLLSLGYELEQKKKGLEIKGVSPEWIERFSKRKKVIARAIAQREQVTGRKVSPKERSRIVHRTRDKKVSLNSEEYLFQLQAQLTPKEQNSLAEIVRSADGTKTPTIKVSERELVARVLSAPKSRKRIPGHEVVRRCLEKGRGGVDLDRLEGVLFSRRKKDPRSQDTMFRPFGRGKARVAVALLARGHQSKEVWKVMKGISYTVRDIERALEMPEIFK